MVRPSFIHLPHTAADDDLTEVLYVDSNVLIAECPEEMEMTDETFAKVIERFEEPPTSGGRYAHANRRMDGVLNDDVFSRAQEAAESARSSVAERSCV